MQKKQPNMQINMQITATIEAWKHLHFLRPRLGSTELSFDHTNVTQWDSYIAWEEVFKGAECPLAVGRPWGHSWSRYDDVWVLPHILQSCQLGLSQTGTTCCIQGSFSNMCLLLCASRNFFFFLTLKLHRVCCTVHQVVCGWQARTGMYITWRPAPCLCMSDCGVHHLWHVDDFVYKKLAK